MSDVSLGHLRLHCVTGPRWHGLRTYSQESLQYRWVELTIQMYLRPLGPWLWAATSPAVRDSKTTSAVNSAGPEGTGPPAHRSLVLGNTLFWLAPHCPGDLATEGQCLPLFQMLLLSKYHPKIQWPKTTNIYSVSLKNQTDMSSLWPGLGTLLEW